jgi:aminoglycoside 6'-N-acetyltransferase
MIRLRNAAIEDLATLQHWDEQPHVLASDPDDDWNWAYELNRTPPWRQQLMAELDGRPIGFVQIIDPAEEESHYWGNISAGYRAIDIWIGSGSDLGKGYGTLMMQQALEKCFESPEVHHVLIDPLASNVQAIRFYERIGFRFVEDRNFGESDCKVYSISRDDWQSKD